jgi:hypothetical protein
MLIASSTEECKILECVFNTEMFPSNNSRPTNYPWKCVEFLSIVHKKSGPIYAGKWRKLHNEELNDLYSLPNIVLVVKSRQMKWAGHVVHTGENRGVHRVLVG